MKLFICTFALCVAICLGLPADYSDKPNKPQCGDVCITLYEPVCCTYANGVTRTFSNSCFADIYNCKNNKTPVSTTPGECNSTATDPVLE